MSVTETFVHLCDYPLPESEEFITLSLDEKCNLEVYHIYTQEATASESGTRVISHLYCEEEGKRGTLCGGNIMLVRNEQPCEIRWTCERCGQQGKITGFENGISDLSHLPDGKAGRFIEEISGKGMDVNEEQVIFAEFLNLTGVLDEFDGEIEAFLDWFMDLPVAEQENFLDDLEMEFNETEQSFIKSSGGLNPDQLYDLLAGDWENNEGPLFLNEKLSANETGVAILFHNARTMLLKAQKEDGLGLTQTGNLQRKVISELLQVCTWPDEYLEKVKRANKVINEYDIWLLHVTRILLQAASLIRKQNGKLRAVKKHARLSLSSRSGELYRHLFIAYFEKINISYLSNDMFDFTFVQDNVPYALYRLQQLADDWVSIRDLKEDIFIPTAFNEIMNQTNKYVKPEWYVYSLMLEPLELFGLIETRETDNSKSEYSYYPGQCRKTPLFDTFISFRFQQGQKLTNNIF